MGTMRIMFFPNLERFFMTLVAASIPISIILSEPSTRGSRSSLVIISVISRLASIVFAKYSMATGSFMDSLSAIRLLWTVFNEPRMFPDVNGLSPSPTIFMTSCNDRIMVAVVTR